VAPSRTTTATAAATAANIGRKRTNARRNARMGPMGRRLSISTSALAVALCTSPSPARASVVPIAPTSNASTPPLSPSLSIPTRPEAPKTSACSAVTSAATGTNARRSRRTAASATYIRPAAARVCPHVRRRISRSGAVGRQVVRLSAKSASASSAPIRKRTGSGSATILRSTTESLPTAPQKTDVADVPSNPPAGIA
jgi:hypothetical protein